MHHTLSTAPLGIWLRNGDRILFGPIADVSCACSGTSIRSLTLYDFLISLTLLLFFQPQEFEYEFAAGSYCPLEHYPYVSTIELERQRQEQEHLLQELDEWKQNQTKNVDGSTAGMGAIRDSLKCLICTDYFVAVSFFKCGK